MNLQSREIPKHTSADVSVNTVWLLSHISVKQPWSAELLETVRLNENDLLANALAGPGKAGDDVWEQIWGAC